MRGRVMERRRNVAPPTQSPIADLEQMPPLILLDRLPVPVVAVHRDGSIVFANPSFADMLGYPKKAVAALRLQDILYDKDADDVSAEQAHRELSSEPGSIKEFVHADSTLVRATVSQSLLRRDDDTITLAVFHDLTERLWNNPRHTLDKPKA
ncbi:PAS domain-containing protein [Rhodococcus sp. KBS0724]|uniref:PAS domain-containing protein n=1 Tax=Rhodococcus sp. KBS0724 TaxID=1179674 RepID=UPI0021B0F109|nr:PAS domain-containing protein [Rhodococcus sp. KBS0724]